MADDSDLEKLLAELEDATGSMGGLADEKSEDPLSDFDSFFDNAIGGTDAPNTLTGLNPASDLDSSEGDVDELGVGSLVDKKYQVLGHTDAADVFEVVHIILQETFDLQVLDPAIVDDEARWDAVQSNIGAAGMLGHEHIEFVTDLGVCPLYGGYAVRQQFEGILFDQYSFEAGPRPLDEVIEFAHTIGSALAALHEIGIVHGHLCDTTVRRSRIDEHVVWRLVDVSTPSSYVESPAPEQLDGDPVPASDQYALAQLILRLLQGDGPFPSVSPVVQEALDRASQFDPADRYEDVESFLAALMRDSSMAASASVHPIDLQEASRAVERELSEASAGPEDLSADPFASAAISLSDSSSSDDLSDDPFAGMVAATPQAAPPREAEVEQPAADFGAVDFAPIPESALPAEIEEEAYPAEVEDDLFPVEVSDQPANPFERGAQPKSAVFTLHAPVGPAAAEVSVQYNTGARLRRDYRRNMLAGGVFVPTSTPLQVGAEVSVDIAFTPAGRAVRVDGRVVAVDPGGSERPQGLAIAFDALARTQVEGFVRGIAAGPAIEATSVLVRAKVLASDAPVSSGAAFLHSRIGERATVGAARAMFAGLPFDFDECLTPLLAQGYVRVEDPPKQTDRKRTVIGRPLSDMTPTLNKPPAKPTLPPTRPPAPPKPTPAPKPSRPAPPKPPPPPPKSTRPAKLERHEWGDLQRVMETVEFFENQRNYMAARKVLESATEHAPDVAAFHRRLAMLLAQFSVDLRAARDAIARAKKIEPRNKDTRNAAKYIEELIDAAAAEVFVEFDDVTTGWVRSEPALHRMWFTSADDTQVHIHAVDTRSGRTQISSQKAGFRIVAENPVDFDKVERFDPQKTVSARERRKRMLQIAKRFRGAGPHFTGRANMVAYTPNATLAARVDSKGLRVFHGKSQLSHVSKSAAYDVSFSPSEQDVAWLSHDGDRWALNVANVHSAASSSVSFDRRPHFIWADAGNKLFAVESGANMIYTVDRRATSRRVLATMAGGTNLTLIPSPDDDSAAIVHRQSRGDKAWQVTRLDLRTGEVRGQVTLPGEVVAGTTNANGHFAGAMADGRLVLADLGDEATRVVQMNVIPESVTGANWQSGGALLVACKTDDSVCGVLIDVGLLLG